MKPCLRRSCTAVHALQPMRAHQTGDAAAACGAPLRPTPSSRVRFNSSAFTATSAELPDMASAAIHVGAGDVLRARHGRGAHPGFP